MFTNTRRPARGATLMEFGLVVAAIAIFVIGAITSLGGSVNDQFSDINSSFGSTSAESSAPAEPELAVQTQCHTYTEASPEVTNSGMADPFTLEVCLTMSEGPTDEWGNPPTHEWALATNLTVENYPEDYSVSVGNLAINVVDAEAGGGSDGVMYGNYDTYGALSFVWDGATVDLTADIDILDAGNSPVATVFGETINMTLVSN